MWRVEHDPETALLEIRARGFVSARDVVQLANAWARAIATAARAECQVLLDLRGLEPMEREAVIAFRTGVKRAALEIPGVDCIVILVDGATVAMQQHHSAHDADRERVTQEVLAAEKMLWS